MYLAIELKKKKAITHLCFLGANNNLVFEILFRVRLRVEIVLGPFVTRFLFVLGLPRVQLIVDSPALDEIVVGALLLHNAISEPHNQVGISDGREAVGDDQSGSTYFGPVERVLHSLFTLVVESGRRLVQQEDFGVSDKGARDCYPLILSAI